ncbi:MAG: hypothetical protein Q4G33_06305 [bacterium]|nr:hypothetical protein [bacterium]
MEKIILHGAKDYFDERGNRVIGYIPENIEIQFIGENALIEVGENFNVRGEGKRFRLCSNSRLIIGNNVKMGEWGTFNAYEEGVIEISDNARFADGSFISVYQNAKIFFGKDFSMEEGNTILCLPYNLISFGADTMMSRSVFVQSNDGHPIFNVNTGENLNCTKEICQQRKIIIGDHVWIGQSAILLYNTDVGSGSIIGAGSLVKGKFPNNCSIAGVPARIIKSDVAWNRHYDDSFESIPEEWRKNTIFPAI